ncbi:MAG: tetratricopeptide repeat protein [Planctomycetes bacterium]|nr:tetratricopeptide repeat protein [Planctomycetota bacterium]
MTENLPFIEITDIIQSLANKRSTGTLELSRDGEPTTYLFFREGMIQHLKAPRSQVILGKALYQLNLIDEADYELTLSDYAQTGRRYGEVLAELGLVSEEGLRQALSFQAREDLQNVLTWKQVQTRFHGSSQPLSDVFSESDLEFELQMGGMSLLMEAARREDEWSLVREHIPHEDDVLRLSAPGAIKAEDLEVRITLLIDGYRSAYEIADAAPCNTLECLHQLAELVREGKLVTLEPLELIELGHEAELDDDHEKALKLYQLARSRGQDGFDLRRRIARAHHMLGHKQEALERWLEVAERCAEAERADLAIATLKEVIELYPTDLHLRQRLVPLLVANAAKADAALQLRNLIALAETNGESPQLLTDLMNQLLELDPSDRPTLKALATLHREEGDGVLAMGRLDELATLEVEADRLEEAILAYREILEIDPENLNARLRLAESYAGLGSTDDAVAEYRGLADILYNSGLIANSINWPFLIRVYESIVELEPSSTPAWEWLAKAYIENNQRDLAISRYLGMAQSLRPTPGEPPSPALISPLARVVELDPTRLEVCYELAHTYLALEMRVEAGRTLRQLAEEALRQEDVPKARSAYQEAIEIDPFDLVSRRGMAALHELQGDLDLAFGIWLLCAELCQRVGLLSEGRSDARRALAISASDPRALKVSAALEALAEEPQAAAALLLRYAEIMHERENSGLALEAIAQARRLDPARVARHPLLSLLSTGNTPRSGAPLR